MNKSFHTIFKLFRAVIGLLIMMHGVARTYYGSIDDFGFFLNNKGFLIGNIIAHCITIFEIVGSILLLLGKFSKWIAPLFALELILGIIMVHSKYGWFVVGHGSNGAEYSIALIISLMLIWTEDHLKPLNRSS